MRFLIDTNIFLHAANADSPDYAKAHEFLVESVRNRTAWSTTWPILYEFLRVATHPRVFSKPLKTKQALAFVDNLLALEELTILSATGRHFETLQSVVGELGHPGGNLLHDIHTATLMREHGVPEIITADNDFLQFRFLKVRNPFL